MEHSENPSTPNDQNSRTELIWEVVDGADLDYPKKVKLGDEIIEEIIAEPKKDDLEGCPLLSSISPSDMRDRILLEEKMAHFRMNPDPKTGSKSILLDHLDSVNKDKHVYTNNKKKRTNYASSNEFLPTKKRFYYAE